MNARLGSTAVSAAATRGARDPAPHRGWDGLLALSRGRDPHAGHEAFLLAAADHGFRADDQHDFNMAEPDDVAGFFQKNILNGRCHIYHPVGTCRMGPSSDPDAVVDAALRVRGVEGRRVADASIMPQIVDAPTHAAAVMIGEKCAVLMTSQRP